MTQIKRIYTVFYLIIFFISFTNLNAQISNDSISDNNIKSKYTSTTEGIQFSAKQLIVPAAFITIGTIGALEKDFDNKVKDKIADYKGDTFIDDILPFVNPASVYVLNWSGIEGKHNFIDRSVILGTSSVITIGSVFIIKQLTPRNRPDNSGDDSFPSMHTAIAFMGAEFLRQEFKDRSIWYGIGGYGIAACTGFLRMYNNKHWLSDVLVGAGIGILGADAAYWIYPEIRKLYKGTFLDNATIVPFASNQNFGLAFSIRIN